MHMLKQMKEQVFVFLGFHKNILISEAACLGHIKKEYVKNNN